MNSQMGVYLKISYLHFHLKSKTGTNSKNDSDLKAQYDPEVNALIK